MIGEGCAVNAYPAQAIEGENFYWRDIGTIDSYWQASMELLAVRPWLLADGATGTNLFGMGLQTGDAPELWNLDHPDKVATHYRSFLDAGADIVLTNSFGGTRYRLQLHGAEGRVR